MKKKLQEIVESKINLLEGEGNWYLGTLRFPFAKADLKNGNGRIYSSIILQREVERMNKKIQGSPISGALEHHPENFNALDKVSHVITKVEWNGDEKTAYAEAKILKTTKGRDLRVLLNTVSLGASMVGFGSVGNDGKIESDYELKSVDLVSNPSFGKHTAVSSANLIESLNSMLERKDDRQAKVNQLAIELVLSGGTKHKIKLDDYFRPHPTPGKSAGAKIREQVFAQKVDPQEWALYEEAKRVGFIGTFKEWKERYLIKEKK